MKTMKINGLPVVDATRKVILTITPQDIKIGSPGQEDSCAVAKACLRQFKCRAVRVHLARIYMLVGKKWLRYVTPGSIRSEIIAFDRRSSFKPGDYTINPLEPSHRGHNSRHTDKAASYKKTQSGTKKSRYTPKHFVEGVRVRAKVSFKD